jgi:ribosome maturation factor RimP
MPPSEIPPGDHRVDLQDCENLSRELSAVLDVEDPIPQAYSLEVSSPGIDRPLRTAQHFSYFAGSEAKIQLAVPLQTDAGERRNFRGILRGVVGDKLVIDVDGQTFELPIADVDHAKLVPDWDAVMKGGSGVGAPPAKPGGPARGRKVSKKKQSPQRDANK